jgi:hypothetical protein
LLGFRANQVVRLEASKPSRHVPLALLVLGPVYSLLEARACFILTAFWQVRRSQSHE